MMKAFCPGHISCFFSPVVTDDVMTTGSLGAGIRLNTGVTVTAEERCDKKIMIIMDGSPCKAEITENVVKIISPDTGFDIIIENDLPLSQGMGMSAAGAVATGLCMTSFTEADEYEAYKAAHIAEVMNKGGLGDVAGIIGGSTPIRLKAGIPPYGRVIDPSLNIKFTVAVVGPRIVTKNILSDRNIMKRVSSAGEFCLNEYMNSQTEKMLYSLSSLFSERITLETKEIKNALNLLRKDHDASMCMLGNSIFTNANEKETRNILGDDVKIFSCSPSSDGPRIIRKA
ncbi:MAG: pantothenate kinase [Methanomassiliicoccaceae archaeon]|nr:pantothenate kinase [Methanomassiliicoccaceae archaeon]